METGELEKLEAGLDSLGLSASADAGRNLNLLGCFIDEIRLWNPRYKLVAAGEDLVDRHVLDSLSGLGAIAALSPGKLADVGSGAGFPGIPLAIYLPDTEIFLIEKMGRRAGFLRTLAVSLGLSNVRVLEMPVEKVSSGNAGFDVVTFRAWSALDDGVLDSMETILAPGGKVAAYKGRRAVLDGELAAIAGRLINPEIFPLKVFGGGEERNLAVFSLA